jgi:hypothetical protein
MQRTQPLVQGGGGPAKAGRTLMHGGDGKPPKVGDDKQDQGEASGRLPLDGGDCQSKKEGRESCWSVVF